MVFQGKTQVQLRGSDTEKWHNVLLLAVAGTGKSPKYYIWTLDFASLPLQMHRFPFEDVQAAKEAKLSLTQEQIETVRALTETVMSDPVAYAKTTPKKKRDRKTVTQTDDANDEDDNDADDDNDEGDADDDYEGDDEPPAPKRQRTSRTSGAAADGKPRGGAKKTGFSRKGGKRFRNPKKKGDPKGDNPTPTADGASGTPGNNRTVLGSLSNSDANQRSGPELDQQTCPQV